MVEEALALAQKALFAVSDGHVGALSILFVVVVLGEIGVFPFPFVLEGVLFSVGYQLGQRPIAIVPLVLVLLLGRQFGSTLMYWLASLLGDRFTHWCERHFPSEQSILDRLRQRLGGVAPLAVIVGRLTPGLLAPTSLACGMIGLRYRHFVLGVFLAAVILDGFFLSFGFVSARGLQYLGLAEYPWLVLVGLAAAVGLVWATRQWVLRSRARC